MPSLEWRDVPVGLNADRWMTLPAWRTVLVVVHTVSAGQRLLDIVRLLGPDLRIQVVFTRAPDVFREGVSEFLRTCGGIVIPWLQATRTRFDLALAASYGSLHELHAPLIVLPHGAGHGKLAPRRPGHAPATPRQVYGLDAQRLVRDGRVIPAAIVLPHEADLSRLAITCPEALPAATVAGDPCYDILRASIACRSAYRTSLEVGELRKLVVVSSTWGPRSLFGEAQGLLRRLLTDLPAERFRLVALIHPNVWYGHGIWQVRAWLDDCLRQGLGLIPPEADWRAVLVAADWIVADHGSVGVYGTVVKRPLLLTGSALRELNPDSANAMLASIAPQLRPGRPLVGQLTRALASFQPERYAPVAARITSQPGRFDQNMHRLMYRLLRLRPPAATPSPQVAALPFITG